MADEKNKFENLIDSEHLALFLDKGKSIIADTAADYVKTESGKGLSTNDFTTALLEKLNGITAGAEPNVNADWNATTGDAQILNKPAIPDVSAKLDKTGNASSTTVSGAAAKTRENIVSGETLAAIAGKLMKWYTDLSVVAWSGAYSDLSGTPTIPDNNKDLTNGAGYQTEANVKALIEAYGYQTASAVQTIINKSLSGITSIDFVITDTLPTTGVKGTFYFVANGDSDNDDVYIEYVWVNGKFEELGPRKIDLSGYLKTSDVSIASNDTINAMFTETTA